MISLISSTAVMQELHNKEMLMNTLAGFENWSPPAGFYPALSKIQSALCFYVALQCFYILAHSMYKQTNRQEHGFTMSFTFSFFFLFLFIFFSFVCRITLPCNSVLTNWIKRTSSGSLTPSWSSTEATRMARESRFCFSVGFSF